jgi:hypothetical protein
MKYGEKDWWVVDCFICDRLCKLTGKCGRGFEAVEPGVITPASTAESARRTKTSNEH